MACKDKILRGVNPLSILAIEQDPPLSRSIYSSPFDSLSSVEDLHELLYAQCTHPRSGHCRHGPAQGFLLPTAVPRQSCHEVHNCSSSSSCTALPCIAISKLARTITTTTTAIYISVPAIPPKKAARESRRDAMGSITHWKETAQRRRQAQLSAIPEEWRLKSIPPDFKVR